jgi:hypothetical protein
MSSPAEPHGTYPDIDPRHGLLISVAVQLVPLFTVAAAGDIPLAHQMAASAIEAYAPESRADYVNVARTLAFSMSALALLGKAAAPDLPMPETLRAFARANALNRSADQSERSMMLRRCYLQANPHPEQPAQPPAPGPDPDDAEAEAAIAAAMQIYAACISAQPEAMASETAPAPAPQASTPPPAPAVSLAPPVTAATASAIRYAAPAPDATQVRGAPHKDELLRHSAMPHVAEQIASRMGSSPGSI